MVPPLDRSYSYDPMGSRRAYTEQGKSVAYAANSANQYDSVSSTENGTPNPENLRYDRNGNLLTDGQRTYTFKCHEWNTIEETITSAASIDSQPSTITSTKSYVWGNNLSGSLALGMSVSGLNL